MTPVMKDLLKMSMIWTDQSRVLAQEMSQSGFVHWLTMWLHAGHYVNTFDQVSVGTSLFRKDLDYSLLYIECHYVCSSRSLQSPELCL